MGNPHALLLARRHAHCPWSALRSDAAL